MNNIDTFNSLEKFLARKQEIMDLEKRMHFSYDLEATLTDEERLADQILAKLKKEHFKNDNFNIVLHDYFENFVSESCCLLCVGYPA